MSITVPAPRLHTLDPAPIRTPKPFGVLAALGAWLLAASTATAQAPARAVGPPRQIEELLRASVSWEARSASRRQVIDQVCLVPDLPSFLEAIAAWDDRHYFPILIDDIETSFKFLRAFRPARVVRFSRKSATPKDIEETWRDAVAAVGRSWTRDDAAGGPAGDAVPKTSAPGTPGVVLSSPDSPMLAGAVALAAGRFQPLIRWDVPRRYGDVLAPEEAESLRLALEEKVAERIPRYAEIGDDCDFITLAGDWPYRYEARGPLDVRDPRVRPFFQRNGGPLCFDDLLARDHDRRARWAFTGRLLGDPAASVYRAMCSLFLQPGSALLLNTYDEADRAWSPYTMRTASQRLERVLPTAHRSGRRADLEGWHQAFDPMNRHGLVMINTHGGPSQFHVTGGSGYTCDVPPSVPAAVLMIHSFSATDPADPATIAGRWLANGAFVYFGSMNEPGLQSFRTPALVTILMAEGVPLSAVMRQSPPEAFGDPWRLIFLGDPLYRVKPDHLPARLPPSPEGPGGSWPRYGNKPAPAPSAGDDARLSWAVRAAVARLQNDPALAPSGDVPALLRTVRRERLAPPLRPYFDALLTDTLLEANRTDELRERLAAIPVAERTPAVRRILEACQVSSLERCLNAGDLRRAEAIWSQVVPAHPSREFLEQVTARVGTLADSPGRREDWIRHLRAAERTTGKAEAAAVIAAERKRVEAMP